MAIERLGQASFPSGRAVLVDTGYLGGELKQDWEAWAAVLEGAGPGPFPIVGERVASGPDGDHWAEVRVELAEGNAASREFVGVIPVETGRLIFIDGAAIPTWDDEHSRDGKADVVFSGPQAAMLAKLLDAPALAGDTYGFTDRPVDEIASIAREAAGILAERGWKARCEQRPHTDGFLAGGRARASATGSGELELAGSIACVFFTSWGNGVFTVAVDRDAGGVPLRLVVRLAPTENGPTADDAEGPTAG